MKYLRKLDFLSSFIHYEISRCERFKYDLTTIIIDFHDDILTAG